MIEPKEIAEILDELHAIDNRLTYNMTEREVNILGRKLESLIAKVRTILEGMAE